MMLTVEILRVSNIYVRHKGAISSTTAQISTLYNYTTQTNYGIY